MKPHSQSPKQRLLFAAVAAAWVIAVGIGATVLWNYVNAPGRDAMPLARWPKESAVPRRTDGLTLLVFAHPQCPCTRATIGELATLMNRCYGRVTAQVLFSAPAGVSKEWTQTDLWRNAAAIPGVQVSADFNDKESVRFQAQTSGYALLYDATGKLLFSGGITSARGHAGDNMGGSAIVAFVNGWTAKNRQTPVFGCALSNGD